jgi:Domain of unknown function (DUF4917)
MELYSYQDVLDECGGKRHLLLGNGFSIACRPELFTYARLFDMADFTGIPRARKAFAKLETTNFEAVIRTLRNFAALANLYAPADVESRSKAENDASALREVLVTAVAGTHPDRPNEIDRQEYILSRDFLRGYKSINTLNYDLLLYWTMMQAELGDQQIQCDDGFRKPAESPDAPYVSWDPSNSYGQTIRYLHGALHLYDTGVEMQKFNWANTQISLIEQVRNALNKNFYPVFVSEGTSGEKVERIRHNDYLAKMYRGFTEIKDNLVVYGHSLDECDDHIFVDRIGRRGKIKRLYVSLYGDPGSPANRSIIRKAESIPDYKRGPTH